MTAAGEIQAGGRILAALVQDVAPLAAYKGALQSVTSSTTLVDDDALYLDLAADATYLLVASIVYTGGTQGSSDLKGAFAIPGGATLVYGLLSNGLSSGTYHVGYAESGTGTWTAGAGGSGVDETALLYGTIVTGAAGTLQFQFAQNDPSATATSVLQGSFLAAWQIA